MTKKRVVFQSEGLTHPKMNILSFTHPQAILNLFEFLSFVEHKEDILKNVGNQHC